MSRVVRKSKLQEGDRARKQRRTFTLSRQSIALLHDLRAARHGSRRRSVSAVLDELLRALDQQRKQEAIDRAISKYYDGLSDDGLAEDRGWGEFSLAQFIDGAN